MDWLINNWYVIVFILICLSGIYVAIADKKKVKTWLEWAVTMVEKEIGSGTGQLKLRQVYDMFIKKFPILSNFIPFSIFSKMVDLALEWMNEQLAKNNAIKAFVENK